MTRCGGEAAKPCMAGQRCLTHGLWDALGDQIAAFLESVTLQEVIDGIPAGKAGRAASGCRSARTSADLHGVESARMSRGAHISRLERDGAAAARGARGHARGARCRRQSVLAACRGPARARPSSRMRASRWRRWSAPSRPRSSSPAAARKPTMPCWPRGWERDPACPASSTTSCWRRRERSGAQRRRDARRRATASCVMTAVAGSMAQLARWRARSLSLQMANNETGVAAARGRRWPRLAQRARARRAHRCRAGGGPHARRFRRARRRLPDALRPQARRAQGRRRAGHSRRRAACPPFIAGGGQERRRRAGTENVAAIAGFGAAAEAAQRDLAADRSRCGRCATGSRRRSARASRRRPSSLAAERRAPRPTRRASPCRAPAPRRWSSRSISRASR